MKKITILIGITLVAVSLFACSKSGDDAEEADVEKEVPKNAFTDYVDTGVGALDASKALAKDAVKRRGEMEDQVEDMD